MSHYSTSVYLPKRQDGRLFAKDLRAGHVEYHEPTGGRDIVWKTIFQAGTPDEAGEYAAWGTDRSRRISLPSVFNSSLINLRTEIARHTLEHNNGL